MPCARLTAVRLPLLLALPISLAACGGHQDATRVFLRDPHQVWVEAWTSRGTRVLLPPGQSSAEVRLHADIPPNPEEPSYASLVREPNGAITLDFPGCAPWPMVPVGANGEIHIVRQHGEERLVTSGRTLRIPFRCDGQDGYTTLDLAFVTPLANVREIHVVHEVDEPIAEGSSHPALQEQAWAR